MLRSLRPNLGLNASRGPRPTREHRQTDRPRRKWPATQDEEIRKGKELRCRNWAKRCEWLNELSALNPELSKARDLKECMLEVQGPSDWAEINGRITQPRPSLSPSRFSETAFETFQQTNGEALTEATVMSKAFPMIAGTADIPSQENLLFGNLKHLTDGSITKAKPDFYEGSRPADLNKQIREELGPYIVPSTNTAAPCLPNFFTEAKGPKGNTDVCKRQALYDGAVGARGIHELRSYVG